eukprot:TRINITY_DN2143_c0_g1::TRINITY_DN2143_c0_g1_i1::g.12913::m.12913 TRINITY_DN2143_c0_g1::TRINITY_DN2143_c0_g1_i1::g.12913  ORF type:complete len:110 (-),score=22.61,sp/Q9DAJ5/DLRB2_MOUSE/67.33/1e-44,Robl_LC7/PF03259.12/8.1e-26 TRINITY_DN2143_c0_g1_i1:230-559(-)
MGSHGSEVEETLKRIQAHKGVLGVIIVNSDGIVIRSTLDNAGSSNGNSQSNQYAALITQLAAKARSAIRDLDPQNDLTFLRVRSKKHEIMVAPDNEYMLIVIQNPSTEV